MDFVVRPRLGFEPNADVFVDDERGLLFVALEVAGADPETLQVSLDERSLLVAGRRSVTARFGSGSWVQKEIADGPFAKRIPLPAAVDFLGETTAEYADGMLVIALPIAERTYIPTTRTEIRMIIKRTLS